MRIIIRGAVQGTGFRPLIYRLAMEIRLAGWVRNSPRGVLIEIEGEQDALDGFLLRVEREKPPRAFIQSLEYSLLEPAYFSGFEIRESETDGVTDALILPDIAVCDDCLAEMYDPEDRRYRYPFINCTHCGPRFSIIESLPYDRKNTSMKSFPLCPDCLREYSNPEDRRFHAQPVACPVCGPELCLWDETGRMLARHDDALMETVNFIRQGKIAAVKGLGGFHLICDARNAQAVGLLRLRKHREEKPFALMYPSSEAVEANCRVTPLEKRLLHSPEAPIVLLERQKNSGAIAQNVASENPYLGVMIPSTPLHHLLMKEFGGPVVATSGNLSDEPLCIDEREALSRLSGIADVFLVHNRPIVRHVDDSIVRIALGRELMIRRARGYAPLPLHHKGIKSGVLAVGGHLKNTIALSSGNNIFLSQHIGDLENKEAVEAFHRVIADFRRLYPVDIVRVAADKHPDYISTKAASGFGVPVAHVQHHHAHVAACMAENEVDGPVLGVAWDGTGYGHDGVIWGGEFLRVDNTGFRRVAAFREFRLPGGAAAVREPRRSALGILCELSGKDFHAGDNLPSFRAFTRGERVTLCRMLEKEIHSPWTTSVGRLFDAVASLCGLRQKISFEGQAAMEIEFTAMRSDTHETYPFVIVENRLKTASSQKKNGSSPSYVNHHLDKSMLNFQEGNCVEMAVVDWVPLIDAIVKDVRVAVPTAEIARKFHNTLAEIILAVARLANEKHVVLTGGCFQNRVLLETTVGRLQSAGFRPFWHQRIPSGDGGIAIGQVVAANAML